MSSLTDPADNTKSLLTMNLNPIQIESDVPMPVFLSDAQIHEALTSMTPGQSFKASKHDAPNIRKIAKRLYYDIHIGKESDEYRRIWLVQRPPDIPTVPSQESSLGDLLEAWIECANPRAKYGSFWRCRAAELLAELGFCEELRPAADPFTVRSFGKALVKVSKGPRSRVSVVGGDSNHAHLYQIDLSPRIGSSAE